MNRSWLAVAVCQGLIVCAPMAAQGQPVPVFPQKKQTLDCSGNCKIDVYARIDASGQCEVMPEYESVSVPAGKTPKMTWRIESLMPAGPHDFVFEFDPAANPPRYGIQIVDATPQDFDDPGYEMSGGKPDKAKFEWKNKHSRQKTFDYVINVLSQPDKAAAGSPCKPIDPRIIND